MNSSTVELLEARTAEDMQRILSFRYDVYVREMNRYRGIADNERGLLGEEVDASSRHYLALDDGEVVAVMRITWGGDAPFCERHVEQYDLGSFIDRLPLSHLVVGERFMVRKSHRGTDLLFRMFVEYLSFCNRNRIQLIFGDCEPHLLNLYQGLGFRTYTDRNVNSPETGYLIPLVMVPEDIDYMRSIGSPLIDHLQDFGADARVPAGLNRLIEKGRAVQSATLSRAMRREDDFWRQSIGRLMAAEQLQWTPFDDLTEEQVQGCIEKSSLITCRQGDLIVKKGNVARNMYLVIRGVLEVSDEGRSVALLSPGDVFGEIAFLIGTPRIMDVTAKTDDVQVLSLSERQIRGLIDSHPDIAATLLLNISKILCRRIASVQRQGMANG